MKSVYSRAPWIDLLKADVFRRYLQNPEMLRGELEARPAPLVVIDEIQKVPQLLDEVHWLIENRGTCFVMCGSSARRLKRGHANLLGGRALRHELYGLSGSELASAFDLRRLLNHGYLPHLYTTNKVRPRLNAYVADYLKEEIAAEGLVRNLPVFSEFLNIASLSDGEIVNFATIARDCGVSSHTIKEYFNILTDTLQGRWLPSYRKRPKRRVIQAPKFYFHDVGVVNFLAQRGAPAPGSELFGKAFENWVHHELTAYNAYAECFAALTYWRLASGIEVDFIVGDMFAAVEAKAASRVTSDHLRGLRALREDQPRIAKSIVVALESRRRKTEDGILILPPHAFLEDLWTGNIFT